LDSIQVKRSSREAIVALNDLVGGMEILEKAKDLAPNSKGVMAIKRLEKIHRILKQYGVEKFVTFDLSMTGTYGYYTGIIFRGYTYGIGDAVVRGGRYDHLVEKFGKKSPSIGFAIVIDELMNALTRQKTRILYTRKNYIVLYDDGRQKEAIALAKDFRRKAKNTELIKKAKDHTLEDYISFGKEYYASTLIYIAKSGEVTMINLVTGEQKIVGTKGSKKAAQKEDAKTNDTKETSETDVNAAQTISTIDTSHTEPAAENSADETAQSAQNNDNNENA
jgi:ATP phosphoribosyltransferase regulatory subunit